MFSDNCSFVNLFSNEIQQQRTPDFHLLRRRAKLSGKAVHMLT